LGKALKADRSLLLEQCINSPTQGIFMKYLFVCVIAGSFLFAGCGSSATDLAVESVEKKCECKKLKKDGDKDGAKACKEEYRAWEKEARKEVEAMKKDMDKDEKKALDEEAESAVKEANKACKDSLK
jgi:hypothetical protein